MKKYNVAVMGATGAVGREMIKILEERNFPINELRLLASAKSVGIEIPFCGEKIKVQELTENSFDGLDFVLGASPSSIAKVYAPHIVKAGALFVDNSSAFRQDPNVPLVVPEINPDAAKNHKGIISNPNCSTIITLVAINGINRLSPIKTMVASTYQAVSGAGAGGPLELEAQIECIGKGKVPDCRVFPYQIAYNLIPQIGDFLETGYTTEEMKMQNESRKILSLPELKVSCTCVRVPVMRSHSISVTIVTERKVTVAEAKEAVASTPGCKLVDSPEQRKYPMPLYASDQDLVYVGRIREDLTNENGLCLWCTGDQVRKGAATNTIQIAELFI